MQPTILVSERMRQHLEQALHTPDLKHTEERILNKNVSADNQNPTGEQHYHLYLQAMATFSLKIQ